MAGSLNRAQLIGNVGRDPEIRSTQSGDRIANISVATSESWKDKNSGERKEKTEWHRVAIFNSGLVDVIEKYVHKGSKIMIEGQIQTRKWTDQQGQEKYTTEIVVGKFDGKLLLLGDGAGAGSGGGSSQEPRQAAPAQQQQRQAARPQQSALDDDEIPF